MGDKATPPKRKLWLYEYEYELVLDTFKANAEAKSASLPLTVAKFQLPQNNQLHVKLQCGWTPIRDGLQSSKELHYGILMKNPANYDVSISAKIDKRYGQPNSGETPLSDPVEIQVGNPLVLLVMIPQTAFFGPPDTSSEVKLIITAHIKENIVDKPSNIQSHIEQLGTLLQSGLFADCKIVTNDDRSYDCHKALLSLKSPVIRTAYDCYKTILSLKSEVIRTASETEQTKEAQTAQINVICNAAILDLVLPYIYTGELPTVTADLALEVYSFAHVYQMEGLKAYLAEEIFLKADQLVSVANVLEFVEIADKIDLSKLKQFCLQLINRNRQEIVNRADWAEFRLKQGHLVDELMLI